MLIQALQDITVNILKWSSVWPEAVKKWKKVYTDMSNYQQYMSSWSIECLSHVCTNLWVEYLWELTRDMNIYTLYGLVKAKKWDIVRLGRLSMNYYMGLWYIVWWDKTKLGVKEDVKEEEKKTTQNKKQKKTTKSKSKSKRWS